jgi:hypothetical protein
MSALSPTYDKTYVRADTALVWNLDGTLITTQVPACGYLQTLSTVPAPSFITPTPGAIISYSALTSNIADVGSHTVTVTSTLNAYTYTAPSPPCQSTFAI